MGQLVDLHSYIHNNFRDKLNVIYDIGASDGRTSTMIDLALEASPTFYLFDARDTYKDQQHRFKYEYHTVLLSDSAREVDFYGNDTSGDSYYLEITGAYKDVQPVKRQTETLDDYCAKHSIPLPDLIKIDTQGSELDILLGGQKAMANAKLIILECPVLEYNIGAPKFQEYIEFMRKHNYLPHSVVELHWMGSNVGNVLIQMDIAFVKIGG